MLSVCATAVEYVAARVGICAGLVYAGFALESTLSKAKFLVSRSHPGSRSET